MKRRGFLAAGATVLAMTLTGAGAYAQEPIKIGLILPMTGPFASTGRQIEAAARLYMLQKGDTVGGRKIQLIVKDDTGVADVTKRIAQELIVNDKVTALAGFGLTPLALATAPLATQAKVPMVVMAAATSIITEQSPFIVRSSFTAAQATVPLADRCIHLFPCRIRNATRDTVPARILVPIREDSLVPNIVFLPPPPIPLSRNNRRR